MRLGKKAVENFKDLPKFSESRDLITESTIPDSTNAKSLSNFILSPEIINYSVTPFTPHQNENKIEERRSNSEAVVYSREQTRKPSATSTKDELEKTQENAKCEKLVQTIRDLTRIKRLQFLRYSFSRLDLYLKQAKSKIKRVTQNTCAFSHL